MVCKNQGRAAEVWGLLVGMLISLLLVAHTAVHALAFATTGGLHTALLQTHPLGYRLVGLWCVTTSGLSRIPLFSSYFWATLGSLPMGLVWQPSIGV
jgi:hypothetical protein